MIKIDNNPEIIFVVLLNWVFRAIYRAKTLSEIAIKISQAPTAIHIEIRDVGYEYNPKINSKLQIYELPNPILEKLLRKVNVEAEENRQGDINTTSIRIASLKSEDSEEENEVNNNVKIQIKLGIL